jgi:hypothetical protein
MDRTVLEGNLKRLHQQLADHAARHGLSAAGCDRGDLAGRIAERIPLSHGTSGVNFAKIAEKRVLLSPERLPGWSQTCTEGKLGTGDGVFLFAGPFSYPKSECGFLFHYTLEDAEKAMGVATPFDSGGLCSVFTRASSSESVVDFLRRHEMPIPGHRTLLRASLESLFSDPWDYVHGADPLHPGPIGLVGGDRRRWTHEVRIHDQLGFDCFLEAVFVAAGRANDRRVEGFLEHCDNLDVYWERIDAPHGNEFSALKKHCVDYLRKKLRRS